MTILNGVDRFSVGTGVTRTWIDANGNFAPDCDLLNPLANDLRGTGGDFCGQMSDVINCR